jgi:hypothetical protein
MPRHAALGSLQRLEETGEELVANSRDKAVLHLRDEDKFFLLVNAHEQRVEAVRAEDVTANDELLLQVRKKLDPRA